MNVLEILERYRVGKSSIVGNLLQAAGFVCLSISYFLLWFLHHLILNEVRVIKGKINQCKKDYRLRDSF